MIGELRNSKAAKVKNRAVRGESGKTKAKKQKENW